MAKINASHSGSAQEAAAPKKWQIDQSHYIIVELAGWRCSLEVCCCWSETLRFSTERSRHLGTMMWSKMLTNYIRLSLTAFEWIRFAALHGFQYENSSKTSETACQRVGHWLVQRKALVRASQFIFWIENLGESRDEQCKQTLLWLVDSVGELENTGVSWMTKHRKKRDRQVNA